jgi:hypothetical protein
MRIGACRSRLGSGNRRGRGPGFWCFFIPAFDPEEEEDRSMQRHIHSWNETEPQTLTTRRWPEKRLP